MNSARVPCGPDIFLFITVVSIIISNAITAHVRAPVGFINNLALKAGDDAIRRGPMRLKLANEDADDDDHREYEDFPQEPTFLQASYLVPQNDDPEFQFKSNFPFKAPSKRYLGIEIPDYVSSPSKGNLLKTIQSRMMAAGK